MKINIKTITEIEKMRIAGRLAAEVLEMIAPHVKSGVTTEALDRICHDYIVNVQEAIPAPLNYHGFPKSICTSINYVVCHGIPCAKKLKDGDIVNIDVTVIKDGYFGDTSQMFVVGKTFLLAQKLIDVTQECLYAGIHTIKPGARFSDIGAAIEKIAHKHNYSVVRDYCGHGIGTKFHDAPQVLHYYDKNFNNYIMEPGMTFTIEPMINAGTYRTKVLADNWTAVTADKKLSAQWEHTILVADTGYEVLTKRHNEIIN